MKFPLPNILVYIMGHDHMQRLKYRNLRISFFYGIQRSLHNITCNGCCLSADRELLLLVLFNLELVYYLLLRKALQKLSCFFGLFFRAYHGTIFYLLNKIKVPMDVRNSESKNKRSFGEIGLNIRTYTSPKVGNYVTGWVSVLWWYVTPVAGAI